MNRRTSKLLDHVVNALIQGGDRPTPPRGSASQLYNHATNLKRKLKRQWNSKPGPVRNAQRMGIIRTLVAMEQSRHA